MSCQIARLYQSIPYSCLMTFLGHQWRYSAVITSFRSLRVVRRFTRFCLVGGLGFFVDSVCFAVLIWNEQNITVARAISFWAAATTTWLGNHIFTYRQHYRTLRFYSWLRYFLYCHLSGALNLLVFWLLKDSVNVSLSFIIGIAAGLWSNYLLSTRLVFAKTPNNRSLDISWTSKMKE